MIEGQFKPYQRIQFEDTLPFVGASASLSIAGSNTYSDNVGGTTHAVNLPASISAGELLLMFFICNNYQVTVSTPSGWTLLANGGGTSGFDSIAIFAKIASGSEGATETVTVSASQKASAITYRVTGNRSGVVLNTDLAITAVNEQSNTINPDPPNLTPSWGSAENLWFAIAFTNDGNMTWSAYPTNYTLGQNAVKTGSGTGNAVSAAARLLTGTSEDPGAFTTVTNRNLSSFTLAVRPQ